MPGADKPKKAAEATPAPQGPATRTRSRAPSAQDSSPGSNEGPMGAKMRSAVPAANASKTPAAPAMAEAAGAKAAVAKGSSSQAAAAAQQAVKGKDFSEQEESDEDPSEEQEAVPAAGDAAQEAEQQEEETIDGLQFKVCDAAQRHNVTMESHSNGLADKASELGPFPTW